MEPPRDTCIASVIPLFQYLHSNICISKQKILGVPIMAQQLMNLTSIHEDSGQIPGLTQWVKDHTMSCGEGRRYGSDLALRWLWCRPAATAPTRPPCLGTSICCGCSPRKDQKKNKNKNQKQTKKTNPQSKNIILYLPLFNLFLNFNLLIFSFYLG